MEFKLYKKKAVFEYGSSNANELTTLDIAEWYQKLGGKIEPDTEIEFVSYFPGSPYERTALANRMPQTYLCEGSGSAVIHQPGGQVDHLSISIYEDITPRALQMTAGHHNLFLQYKIGKNPIDQTNEIPNRHLPLTDNVIIKACLDEQEIMKKVITPRGNAVAAAH